MSIFEKPVTETEVKYYTKLLTNWKKFSKVINSLNEEAVKTALCIELKTLNRVSILQRLRGRFNILRYRRESLELLRISEDSRKNDGSTK